MSNALARSMAHEFNRGFISDLFGSELFGSQVTTWPPIDIYEMKDKYVLHMDAPGFKDSDIKIEYSDGKLTLEGKREEGTLDDAAILVRERARGSFKRVFELGENVQAEKIQADYQNGTLTIQLPKSEKALPRVIPIQINK